jgi:peptide-methionine (S)-S-oxide reductase
MQRVLCLLSVWLWCGLALGQVTEQRMTKDQTLETATLAGGCFWCTEAIFRRLKGVQSVEPGYTGGSVPNPTYAQVSTGATGHAEAVEIVFDPREISFKDLLQVFFHTHDPTTLNRQGADRGTEYRSAIFYHSEDQRKVAELTVAEIEAAHVWSNPLVTQIIAAGPFYRAENYHKDYYARNPEQPYCTYVIGPKIEKLGREFKEKLK